MRKNLRGGAVNSAGVIDDLFLTALNRHTTAAEVTALKDVQNGIVLAARDEKKGDDKPTAEEKPKPKADDKGKPGDKPKPGDKKPAPTPTTPPKSGPTVVLGTTANDMRFYQDVLWAILNTTEFMLNH